ncbi:hypothetical protein ACWGH5_28410 [Streptomyces sp. NPDC054864]
MAEAVRWGEPLGTVRRHPRLRSATDETLRRRTVVTFNGLRRLPVVLGSPVDD